MVSDFTGNLRLTQQGDNDNPDTWGQVVNNQVIGLVEDAVSGVLVLDVTGTSDVTLTTANGAVDQARNAVIEVTGVLGNDIDIFVPSVSKVYQINAKQTGGSVTVKISGGSGVTFANGETATIYSNGTDVLKVADITPPQEVPDAIPTGAILLWSGSIGTIPSGWALCDGNNGTPNLTDKFVQGAGGSLNPDDTGGSTTAFGSTSSRSLSTSQMPSHNHNNGVPDDKNTIFVYGSTTQDMPGNASQGLSTIGTPINQGRTETVGGNSSHDHTFSVDTVPPYYALAYIMKL